MAKNLTPVAGTGTGLSTGFSTAVSIYRTTNQSIPNSVDTAILFDAESWDTDNLHSLVSNTSRITIAVAGRYRFSGQLCMAVNVTGLRYRNLRVNGVVVQSTAEAGGPTGSGTQRIPFSIVLTMAVNDYFELVVHQTIGSALNAMGGVTETFVQMQRVS